MKKFLILLSVCVLLVITFFACNIEKTYPIKLPNPSDIKSIEIITPNLTVEKTDEKWIEDFIKQASMSNTSKKQSVSDVPNVTEYVQIDFVHKTGGTSVIYVYNEGSTTYIAQPYQGLYYANSKLVKMIK